LFSGAPRCLILPVKLALFLILNCDRDLPNSPCHPQLAYVNLPAFNKLTYNVGQTSRIHIDHQFR